MRYRRLAGAIVLSILPALAYAQAAATDPSNPSGDNAGQQTMSRVTGIGGIFLRANDPATLRAWYKKHLGIDVQQWGGTAFRWVDSSGAPTPGTTKFGWVMDPEGNKIELWEPPAGE